MEGVCLFYWIIIGVQLSGCDGDGDGDAVCALNLRNGETRGDFGVDPNGIQRSQWLCIPGSGTKCHCNSRWALRI